MKQFSNLFKIILLAFVVCCNCRSYKNENFSSSQEYKGSGDFDSEENNDSDNHRSNYIHSDHAIEPSPERGYIHQHKHPEQTKQNKTQNFINEFTGKEEEDINATENASVMPSVETVENVTCEYQNYNGSLEDDDESKSTLIDYPFAVSIQKKGAHFVSGALIDKRWILSVAGEFYHVRDTLKLFRARLGSVDCKRGGSLVPIKKIEIHPYYIYKKPNFDVALLRIAIPVEYSEVLKPIAISKIRGKVLSAKFMTTYWPRIVINGSTLPETAEERIKYNSMRVSTQRLIPIDKCKIIMNAVNEYINESSLCLKPVVTHHSVCMPDAGAPVVAEDGLWGITSGWVAETCPSFVGPTIFTRISSTSVRSWLDTQLHSQ